MWGGCPTSSPANKEVLSGKTRDPFDPFQFLGLSEHIKMQMPSYRDTVWLWAEKISLLPLIGQLRTTEDLVEAEKGSS